MNDLILIKSGALGDKEEMPRLNYRELGYCTDKKELYIGTNGGNERLCGAEDAEKIVDLDTRIKANTDKISAIEDALTGIKTRLDAIEDRLGALEKPSE